MNIFRLCGLGTLEFAVCLLLSSMLLDPVQIFAQELPKQPAAVDLLVKGATIVTMDPDRQVIENGFIAIRGDQIIAIGQEPASALPKGFTAKQTIDATG